MKEKIQKAKSSKTLRTIIIAVVIIIPLLYSFFYLKAFWDPYGNLQNVKVGVVNLDKGVDGQNLGEELQNKLLDKDTMDFQKVNEEDAYTSLANQEYYALITIPKDFTENLNNAENADRKVTTITYSPNKKSNYLASQIINSAVKTIEKEVRAEVSEKVVATLTDKLNEVPDKMQEISDGAGKLTDGTQTLANSYSQFDKGVDSAYTGSKSLEAGIDELNAGINKLADGTGSVDTLISSVNTLATKYSQLDSGLQQYVAGVNSSNEQVTSMVTDLLTYAQKSKMGVDGSKDLQNAIKKASALAQSSAANKGTAKDAAVAGKTLTSGSKQINSGIQTLNEKVAGLKQLSSGVTQLQQGGVKLKEGSNSLTTGLQTLSSSSKQVKDGINTLNSGANELKTGVDDGITDTKEQLTKLNGLDEYAANPVEVKEEDYGNIDAYGVGFAPYFISLSLWVGALMAFVVLYYDQDNRFKLFGKNAEKKILRTLMYGVLAIAQGVALGFLLKLGLGYEVTNAWLYYGTCILIAILFLNIIEFLIVTFGDIGKLSALVLLVLQLAATGGTFPVETIPAGFQKLYNFLPMSYTIKLLKESLVCIDSNLLKTNLTVLLVMTAVFIGINAFNDIVRKGVEIKSKDKE